MTNDLKWKIIEIECSEFNGFNIEELNAQFRCDQPVLLIYKFKFLPWTGVAKIAPIDHMLVAPESDSYQIFRQLSKWGSSLNDDKGVYENFKKELKTMRLKKEVPMNFFHAYAGRSSFLGKSSNAFKPFQSNYAFRIAGICLPNAFYSLMVDHYFRELVQFGGLAFYPVMEGYENSDEAFDIIKHMHLVCYKDADVMKHPFNSHWNKEMYNDDAERLKDVKRLIDKIKNMLEQKKKTGNITLDLFYHNRIRPVFFMMNIDDYKVGDFEWTKDDVELYGLRARLLRELAWPQSYKHLMISDINDWIVKMDENHPMIRMVGTYNFVDEMTTYFKEMAERYPVLFENPLVDLV